MDRRRGGSPAYARQRSGGSSSTGSFSPAMSPVHHHVRSASTGFSNVKRTQNVAAKAAAQRLAQVMASQTTDDDDDDEDNMGFRFNSSSNLVPNHISVVGSLRPTRSPSPALGRNFVEHAPSVRSTSAGRPSIFVRSTALVPPSRTSVRAPSAIAPIEPPTDRGRARRLAGATLLALVVNYWWLGFLDNLSRETYNQQLLQDEWTLRIAHYAPLWLTYWWKTKKWFLASRIAAHSTKILSTQDQVLFESLIRCYGLEFEWEKEKLKFFYSGGVIREIVTHVLH